MKTKEPPIKISFKKEWNEQDFELMKRAITRHFGGKKRFTHHNPQGVEFPYNFDIIDNVLGLAYTSSSSFALYGICNTQVKYGRYGSDYNYEFFVISEDNIPFAILWDKDENEKYIKL